MAAAGFRRCVFMVLVGLDGDRRTPAKDERAVEGAVSPGVEDVLEVGLRRTSLDKQAGGGVRGSHKRDRIIV